MVDPEKGGKIMTKVQLLMSDPKVKASAAALAPVKQEKAATKTAASTAKTNNIQQSENDTDSDWWSIW